MIEYVVVVFKLINNYLKDARRQQMVEAAEKRRQEQERRGIGNVEAVKRQQKLSQQREERSEGASTTGGLRVRIFLLFRQVFINSSIGGF